MHQQNRKEWGERMPYEDVNKSYIEILIANQDWQAAYNALQAYIDLKGEDYWAKSQLALVEAKLR